MNEISEKIQLCLDKFEGINQAKDSNTKVDWFNEFCGILSDLLMTAATFIKNSNSNYVAEIKQSLLLYLTQLTTLLSLLIKVFLTENDLEENIHEARKFVIKQLETCFEAMGAVLRSGNPNEPDGSFLKFMDLALDKLSQIDVENDRENALRNYHEARNYAEEVLCYAMSIAQVSGVEASKTIKGSSKAVLEELKSLHIELTKHDLKVNFCNLFVDCCYDRLCALEKKVNFAVLRLGLKIFSEYTQPIKELNNFCLNRENIYNEDRLDDLVADLDGHVDRIMQIGLFAIAASTNVKTGIYMKSCLASLEALEAELVPSFNGMLLNPTLQNKNYAYTLEQFWIQQANTLKELIYNIIDPFAFCQVVYDELKQHIDDINGYVKSDNNAALNAKYFEAIIRESNVLTDLVSVSIGEMNLDNKEDVKRNIAEIKIVLHEIKSANTLLLANKTKIDPNSMQRVFKRVKILKGSVRKLLLSLSNADAKNDVNQIDSVEENKIAHDGSSSSLDNNDKLNELFNRGKELLNERSILYKTPKKDTERRCQTTASKRAGKVDSYRPMPLLKTVHLRNVHFSYSKVADDGSTQADLQITDILKDLEDISSTFSNTF